MVLHVASEAPLAAVRVTLASAALLADAPDGGPVRVGGGHEVAGAAALVAGAVGVDGLVGRARAAPGPRQSVPGRAASVEAASGAKTPVVLDGQASLLGPAARAVLVSGAADGVVEGVAGLL